ncbi:hypothetical protein N7462_009200 [Penicillium macrosclerotiorum]|uniref:uncharacterized protein n=1 Tax=Penicillium macrosclerotiorum TaxID=303699 RepID=UPI002546DF47|nr:uncharacterized protein N7462_009200 [Penicillium macrosclerotiorum]KAJ5673761.1 hypothetical protein N7462_009200 [Penicillium macrosclerotiorum]
MSSIIVSLKHLIDSIFEVIYSIFSTAFHATTGVITTIVDFFVGIVQTALRAAGNTLEAIGGLGKFIASNLVIILLIAGGVYGYVQYQGRQGRSTRASNKKLN